MDTVGAKAQLRGSAQARRGRAEPVSMAASLSSTLAGAVRVASYLAFGSEPVLPPEPGWLMPVLLADGQLDWAVYDGATRPGRRGGLEPTGERLGVAAVASCDVVVVPALLVDCAGYRLGKGGGSYDRALSLVTGLTIALVGDEELVGVLPTQAHDVPVRAVATPSRGVVLLPITEGGWETLS